ncbi:MAG TPA: zinc ribbon domain-containing protein [Candidatus Eisenbacteria bacterium]|nr:zinc ribbon domain-containing protein [Candidatus Eisenbacteria bacterium]
MPTEATAPPAKVILGCSKCGAALPDEAQFCLKCGKPISLPPKDDVAVAERVSKIVEPRRKPRIFLWVLVGLLLGLIGWVAISDDPFAQGLQELGGWKHDDSILETPFSVNAHNFRYYKFSLPEGSVHVSIIGHFSAAPADKKAPKPKGQKDDGDSDIEVYVLSEPAFAVWQNGYATSSVYESGRVTKGDIQAELPAGAGIYYLIFSNKFAPKSGKSVDANVLLRYKSWVPEWVRLMKARFWNWIGT